MEWMILPLKRYADFQGRSRRKEYWMFTLGYIILIAIIAVLGGVMGAFDESGGAGSTIFLGLIVVVALALFIPGLAVQVRRFHDQDKSGWFVLLGFIPYVGGLIVLIFMLLEGTKGPNRFGPDPKDPNQASVFE